jgi:hypothetical protein
MRQGAFIARSSAWEKRRRRQPLPQRVNRYWRRTCRRLHSSVRSPSGTREKRMRMLRRSDLPSSRHGSDSRIFRNGRLLACCAGRSGSRAVRFQHTAESQIVGMRGRESGITLQPAAKRIAATSLRPIRPQAISVILRTRRIRRVAGGRNRRSSDTTAAGKSWV